MCRSVAYYEINSKTKSGQRTAQRLLALREQFEKEVPKRTANDPFWLATWNIREFDSPAYGERLDESFYYIAEVISHFDLVAVQEVRKDLKALKALNRILGSYLGNYVRLTSQFIKEFCSKKALSVFTL